MDKTVAITGATGFLGRYIINELEGNYKLRCWRRESSNISDLPSSVDWITGELSNLQSAKELLEGADLVVHSALYREGGSFIEPKGDPHKLLEKNLMGSLQIFEEAYKSNVSRFVFISTCAVHDVILKDRDLNETHPLWPKSHYGAHKAALEKFVHSYGFGKGMPICALRPTGIYGLEYDLKSSKWFDLISAVAANNDVECARGGKEVHVKDVARAVKILLEAPEEAVRGQAFNCYDRYVSEYEVAEITKELAGSRSKILGEKTSPVNQIDTSKIRSLGMSFGGENLLTDTIGEILRKIGA